MRALTYKLADGTSVKTYPEAVESGQRFTEVLTDIPEATSKRTFVKKWEIIRARKGA